MVTFFFSHLFSVSVGLALIGGLLAWINRKGGCTSRSKPKRPADFEDFGLAETDFPHHRSPPMAAANVAPGMAAAGAAGAAGAGAAAAMASPTIPRLNEQGNYYDPSTAEYGTNRIYYEPQLTGPPQPDYQYPPHHQQQYYYPQEGGYYDEHGYYYENGSTAVSSPGQQQAMYDPVAAGGNSDYYKPDSADGASAAAKPNQRM